MRRGVLLLLLCGAALGLGGAALLARERMAHCAAVPLLAGELVPAPDFTRLQVDARSGKGVPPLPAGWSAPAPGVQVGNFTITGSGHSFQLIGIANEVRSPPVDIHPGDSYCVAAQAIADSPISRTKLRVVFDWLDPQGRIVATDGSDWQDVRRWEGSTDHGGWSRIVGAFQAPATASRLAVSFHPASDDRVYLDDIHIRSALADRRRQPSAFSGQQSVVIQPWPNGSRAALSFSFDWETAMGGLIHSRSDDPNGLNWQARAMRMREGVTTTLDLFRPYGIRATYYANGYNFLLGNTEKRQFMGNPTFIWAKRENRWPDDTWATTPWFAKDPYSTVQRDPGWYFGDLIPALQKEHQDIQSHSFSHFYGGKADAATWRADLMTWKAVAAERGVPPARSLAFPWSGSDGMSYTNWDELAAAGITSVTRTSWTQDQYDLFQRNKQGVPALLECRPVPGHERILACPDFYLHSQETAAQAIALIDKTIAVSGTIDLWAHTEEVTSPDQIAAWRAVVSYAAQQRDAGKLWIAPLAEIADWQQALAEVRTKNQEPRTENSGSENPLSFTVTNGSQRDLKGLTLTLPFNAKRVTVNGSDTGSRFSVGYPLGGSALVLNIHPGETVEVVAWPV